MVRLTYLSLENDNENHSTTTTKQMSRQESIEGDRNPTNKATRSNTTLPRASTFSQTIQIITSKFKFPASPKLRRTRKRSPYERTIEETRGPHENEEYLEEINPQIVEDPSETEVFFKQSITTSQVYQTNHSLDDTIPYLDPLLELPRDSHIAVNLPDIRPPSPFLDSFVRQAYTPPLLPHIEETRPVLPGTSGDTTYAAVEPAEEVNLTEALQESEGTGIPEVSEKQKERHG